MRYRFILLSVAKIKKPGNNRWPWGCGEIGTLRHGCWEQKRVQPLWETVRQLLKTWNRVSMWPSNSMLGVDPRQKKMYVQRKTHVQIFIATLFVRAEMWKQLKFPSNDVWLLKGSLSRQWNIIQSQKGTKQWYMFQHRCNLRDVTLRYRSRIERATDCMILFTEDVRNRQIYRERKHVSGCLELGLDRGGKEKEEWLLGGMSFLFRAMKMF